MSKNIVIQEGGVGRQFTADKLKTALVGGGSCNWVPEDETTVGTKHITENGTYKASDDGYYGYSQVTVSGIGSATGTDPDTGETVNYSTNGQTGEIEKRVLPIQIKVATPPTKQNYEDGDLIDFTGIVVKAYKDANTLWDDEEYPLGVIPRNELTFSDKVADITKVDNEGCEITDPVYSGDTYTGTINGVVLSGDGIVVGTYRWNDAILPAKINGCYAPNMFFTLVGNTIVCACTEETMFWITTTGAVCRPVMHDNKTAYVGICDTSAIRITYNGTIPTTNVDGLSLNSIGWLIIYGSETGDMGRTGGQPIKVTWERPNDGKELEDSFKITVTTPEPDEPTP